MFSAKAIRQQYHFRHTVPQNSRELQRSPRAIGDRLAELRKAARPIIEVRNEDNRLRRELAQLSPKASGSEVPEYPGVAPQGAVATTPQSSKSVADLVSIRPTKF